MEMCIYVRSKGWVWVIGAFSIGFLIASYIGAASTAEPGAVAVARKPSFLFKLVQKTMGREVVWMSISGLRVWKNIFQAGAIFFGWQVWAIQVIENALLY